MTGSMAGTHRSLQVGFIIKLILYFSLVISTIIVLIDPTGLVFGVSKILMLFVFAVSLVCCKAKISAQLLGFMGFVSLIPAFFSLLVAILSMGIDFDWATSTVKNYLQLVLLVFPLTLFESQKILNVFVIGSLFLVISYVLAWASFLFPDLPLLAGYFNRLYDADNTVMLGSGWLLFTSTMFYKTSPVLLLLFGYLIFLREKKWWFLTLAVGLLLFASGTQANQLSVFLIVVFKVVSCFFHKYSTKSIFILFIVFSAIVTLFLAPVLFDLSDGGNMVKYGHLISYLDEWNNNSLDFFVGSGLGISFYSFGRLKQVFVTELSWLEFVRRHGIFLSLFFFGFIFFPVKRLLPCKKSQGLMIGYLAYLFTAATNPLLTSNTGFFVIAFAWSYADKINSERRKLLQKF